MYPHSSLFFNVFKQILNKLVDTFLHVRKNHQYDHVAELMSVIAFANPAEIRYEEGKTDKSFIMLPLVMVKRDFLCKFAGVLAPISYWFQPNFFGQVGFFYVHATNFK